MGQDMDAYARQCADRNLELYQLDIGEWLMGYEDRYSPQEAYLEFMQKYGTDIEV